MQVLSFKLNVGHFPHLADLVARINYNNFYMSDGGNLMTTPSSESATARLGKAFANWTELMQLLSVTYDALSPYKVWSGQFEW